MATIGSLIINLVGNHKGLTNVLNDAKGQLDAFKTAGGLALAGIGVASGGWAVTLAADVEQLSISFKTLLGSSAAAAAMMKDMRDFALRTPFEFEGIAEAAKRMLALGFNAQQIIPMLENVGDAVAALGGGKEALDRAILALSQMQAKGKVMAQEMNQLAEIGIAGWEILASSMGKSVAEVMKLAEQGMISSTQAIPAIMAGMKKKYGGAMADQINTTKALWLNLSETVSLILTNIGTFFLPVISQTLKWTRAMIPLIAAMGAFLLVQVAIAAATRAYVAAQTFALALSGPTGWAKIAAGAAVAATTLIGVSAAMRDAGKATADATSQISKFNTASKALAGPTRLQQDQQEALDRKANAAQYMRELLQKRAEGSRAKEKAADSALSDAWREADDELGKLTGKLTDTDIKLRDLGRQGVSQNLLGMLKKTLDKIEEQKSLIKAQEESEKRVNDQRERGVALMEKFASPAEQALKSAQELQALFDAGAIDKVTLDRATAANKPEARGTAALAADTKEAFSAFLTYQRGGTKDPMLEESKKQTKAQEKSAGLLGDISKKLKSDAIPVKI